MKNEKAKHTPGPWRIHITFKPVDTYNGWIIKEAGEPCFPICLVPETIGGTRSPQKANAALIAAAPDLLAALENARIALSFYRDMVKDINEPKGHNTSYPFGIDTEKQIRAAISKAKGE